MIDQASRDATETVVTNLEDILRLDMRWRRHDG
jgi:hypothetical protein